MNRSHQPTLALYPYFYEQGAKNFFGELKHHWSDFNP